MLLVTVMAGSCPIVCLAEETGEPTELYARAAVLMDADSGRVLYSKNGEEVLPMASTTKIMTCIVALENGNPEDQVTVSFYAAGQPKVHLGLVKGQKIRMEDLFYSMMLESHNDSAVAIAEHIGGKLLSLPEEEIRSQEESKQAVAAFACLMNQKARDIGCFQTFFVTPNGLDAVWRDENGTERSHATTARDLAAIMRYCIRQSEQREKFLEITRTSSYSFTDVSGNRSYSCQNHNAFLQMMEGALSGKTGFTNAAGYCYVGALEKDGKCFTVALLACGWPNHKTWKWSDTKKLMAYGLSDYSYHSFEEREPDREWCEPIPVENGKTDHIGEEAFTNVRIETAGDAREGMLLKKGEQIELKCQKKRSLTAPVTAGEEVGQISYLVDGKVFRMDLLVTEDAVEPIDMGWCLEKILDRFLLNGIAF
ncbi:MAG: D-alanyl-D-alanine carboxypeptidase [Lachnospiraceae bacterium]|nr:D-alanyl-D-alanine carboxypeptidase [Lachnospiraceae bacterium]